MILIEKNQQITSVNGTSVKIKARQKSASCCLSRRIDYPFDKRKKRLHLAQGCKWTVEGKRSLRRIRSTLTKNIDSASDLISSQLINDDNQLTNMKREEQRRQRTRRRRRRRPRLLPASSWLLAIFLLFCINNYCNCDTNTTTTTTTTTTIRMTNNPDVSKSTANNHQVTLSEASRSPPKPSVGSRASEGKAQDKATSSRPSSHKDELMWSLSDSIERQHFRMGPIRSLVHQRPSKFDSGHQTLKDLPVTLEESTGANKRTRTPLVGAPSKADDSLRHIMMMHEHAASSGVVKTTTSSTNKSQPADKFTRLRYLAGPANLLMSQQRQKQKQKQEQEQEQEQEQQQQIINANKIISYLSLPLVKSKPILDNLLGSSESLQASSQQNSTSTRLLKSPFSARANNKMSSLQGLAKKLANQPAGGAGYFSSTDSPKTSVLTRPSLFSSSSSSSDQNKKNSALFSTPMPTILNDRGQKYSFQNNQQNQIYEPLLDLIADSSWPIGTKSDLSAPSNVPESSKQASSSSSSSSSSTRQLTVAPFNANHRSPVSSWLKQSANQMAHGYVQDSLRDLLTLSQLPILSAGPISTAPSDLEPGGKKWLANKMAAQQQQQQQQQQQYSNIGGNRSQTLDDILRYAYIFGSGVRRKRDPLKVLGPSKTLAFVARRPNRTSFFKKRSNGNNKQTGGTKTLTMSSSSGAGQLFDNKQLVRLRDRLNSMLASNKNAKPRGVMWDMATDPSLAVTVFHLLERASVALPLGFLLMPFVHMIRNPLNGIPLHHHGFNAMNLGRILPARASHRSVDYEELAKRLDLMDKILSRALRQTHREA